MILGITKLGLLVKKNVHDLFNLNDVRKFSEMAEGVIEDFGNYEAMKENIIEFSVFLHTERTLCSR